jgi:hypothetical protein
MDDDVRADLALLSRELLGFAHQTLTRYDAFLPFAAVIQVTGDLQLVAADDADPDASRLLDDLYIQLAQRATAGAVRAAGVCYEVTLAEPLEGGHEAVALGLEHGSGAAMRCLVPYRRESGAWTFGRAEAAPAPPRVFDPPLS